MKRKPKELNWSNFRAQVVGAGLRITMPVPTVKKNDRGINIRAGKIFTRSGSKSQAEQFRALIALAVRNIQLIDGPVEVIVEQQDKQTVVVDVMPHGLDWPVKGRYPDVDGLLTTIMDMLEGIAYADDKQVVSAVARRSQ